MTTALVNRIIPFSSVDGPGNRTAVFLQSCNFNCKYCHNPETINRCVNCACCVSACKAGALSIRNGKVAYDSDKCILCDECIHICPNNSSPRTMEMTAEEVMARVKKNIPFVRGLTVSGGECTLQRDFLVELLRLAKDCGLNTLLDSNGSYSFADDKELMDLTDGVMLDIKAWNSREHESVTGCDNSRVLENMSFLAREGKLFEVRTVVVPELFDAYETVDMVSKEIVKISHDVRYKIIKYRENGVRPEYRGLISPKDAMLKELEGIARNNGLTDIILI